MNNEEVSDKSYGAAVALCGIFGVLGVHHFYLGNVLHGVIDLGMIVLVIYFAVNGQILLAYGVFLLDAIHTMVVFYLLIVEKCRDGKGRLVKLRS